MTTLYIATHNKTGMKYFGKTNRFHTEEELQKYYRGSCIGWREHLQESGDDVTMEVYYQSDFKEEIKSVALFYSPLFDIANSPIYLNRKTEDGGDSGVGSSRKIEFTNEEISLIRDLLENKGKTLKYVSKLFNCDQCVIQRIIKENNIQYDTSFRFELKKRVLNDEEKNQISLLINEGKTIHQVSKIIGVSPSVLKKSEFTFKKDLKRFKNEIPKETIKAIKKMLENGNRMREVIDRFRYNETVLYRVIKENNIRYDSGYIRKDFTESDILNLKKMVLNKVKKKDICEYFGIGYTALENILIKNNIQYKIKNKG